MRASEWFWNWFGFSLVVIGMAWGVPHCEHSLGRLTEKECVEQANTHIKGIADYDTVVSRCKEQVGRDAQ